MTRSTDPATSRGIQKKAEKRRMELARIVAATIDTLISWAKTQNDRAAIRELAQKVKDIEEGKA